MTEALRTNAGVRKADGLRSRPPTCSARSAWTRSSCARYPHELSGGMLQRVMIAAALLTRPRLLLADEPTTALDVTTQAEVMAILAELRRDFGLALLFITHDLELAAAVCDRTAVMYAGQVVEVRDSALLHDRPAAPVHGGAGRRPAGHRQVAGQAAGDTRPAAVRVRGAGGRLRVRAPLRARRARLRDGAARC